MCFLRKKNRRPKRKTLKYAETKRVLAVVAEDAAAKSHLSAQAELDAITAKLTATVDAAPTVNSAAVGAETY